MKKKENVSKKQLPGLFIFVVLLTVVLCGAWLKKPTEIKAFEKQLRYEIPEAKDVPLVNTLPNWKNALTNFIPKENAFTLKYFEGLTEIIDVSPNIEKDPSTSLGYKEIKNNLNNDFIPNSIAIPMSTGESSWIKIKNVGYYNGEFVGLKITMTPRLAVGEELIPGESLEGLVLKDESKNYFYVRFIDGTNGGDVKYELLDEDGNIYEKKDIGSYISISGVGWFVGGLYPSAGTLLSGENLESIYSLPPGGDHPLTLGYLDGFMQNYLTFVPTEDPRYPRVGDARATFTAYVKNGLLISGGTISLDNKGQANSNTGGIFFYPSSETKAKIEIPDPQGIDQTFQILNEMEAEINYKFIQQIPYEGKFAEFGINNRNQTLKWIITSPTANKTVKVADWKVTDETGVDRTSWFAFSPDGEEEGTAEIEPNPDALVDPADPTGAKIGNNATDDGVAPDADEFYNHYYTFERKLTIDYNQPIDENLLDSRGDDNYLDNVCTVILTVDDKKRDSQTFKTSINFAAPIEYQLIDSVTRQPISQTIVPLDYINNKGLVTWLAPLPNQKPSNVIGTPAGYYTAENAPKIPGYQFKSAKLNVQESAKLNGQAADMQVKYTKLLDATSGDYTQNNVVTLYYTPLTYQVGITVKDSKDGEVLSPTETNPSAETHFQAAVVASKGADGWEDTPTAQIAWKPLSEIDFTALDKQYQIRQVSLVKEGYDWDKVTNGSPSNPSPKFWVELATNNETTEYQVKLETGYILDPDDPYTNHGYLFPATLTVSGEGATQTRALPLTVINKPIGELKLPTLEQIHFGTDKIKDKDGKEIEGVSLPRENTMIQRSTTSEDWKIKVEDDRLTPYQTGGWKLEATMTQDFTWTDPTDPTRKSVISNILVFCPESKDFENATPMGVDSTAVVIKDFDTGSKEMTWGDDEGFLLKVNQAKQNEIMAKGTDGKKYVAELEFVLTADPLSEPGK